MVDMYHLKTDINNLKARVADLEETIQLILSYVGLGISSTAVARIVKQNLKNKEIHDES